MLTETHIPDNSTTVNGKNRNTQGFLKGIPSSSGIAVGNAFLIETETFIPSDSKISADMIESEITRIKNTIEHLNNDYTEVLSNSQFLGSSVISIIETYQLIINDTFINNNIFNRIREGYDSESAVIGEYELQKSMFRNSKDQLLRERSIDLDNVKRRFLAALRHHIPDYESAKDKILVALTISPTDLVKYKEAGAIGIITEMGGIASHVSILARSFEMPAIIGVKDAAKIISVGLGLIIDGFTGLIIYNPDLLIRKRYDTRISDIEKHKKSLGRLVKVKSETLDKHRIKLLANIDRLDDIKSALITGSDGAGLVRTESFLAHFDKIPDEEVQYGWYREIADRLYPNPVTIRCFDIGSDKFSLGIPIHENNPALGLRGIRFLLYNRDVFTTQIKAILRASVNKNVKIMLPMVSDIHELITAKKIINECIAAFNKTDLFFDNKVPVGIMIETPSAVLSADYLAKESDFFSIGTNDLTQYTLAADRTNDLVTEFYDSFHPSVLKMISMAAKSAEKAGIPISICGELAGHAAATPLLIGMGISELSVPPSLVLELKNRILKINYQESKILADRLLQMSSSDDILKVLESEINEE